MRQFPRPAFDWRHLPIYRMNHILTKPIAYPGGSLHINARTSAGGAVRVAIRRADGEFDGLPLPLWSYERCSVFSADSIDHTVEWNQQENLSSLNLSYLVEK